ncbi:hypothetical protein LTR10_022790 [Elasticomyces elasticus]|uniref:Flavin reductase like domain-containing protein n=1 Tax=Exophiala sideris TaxID=1016849 RepID=A0ABR0JLV7_9EURO|nr:hypothetical protein LTR10_022790 [Elasticomyces elasticus]KAK5036582.1 hypothetical protein LTS07_002309 [Exophiala sideris]KAK5041587.1 hypothetical protein LTR13_002254 [Exophiala sideris]KAK5066965.1 hypothetical protein LTR69_002313 [Exophiala sideris]KAK5185024.1 hypothetical protein LTR44_002870 [Eurotiomycetes sp. CCFEE 6388]
MLSNASFGRFAKLAYTTSRSYKTNFSPQEFQQLCHSRLTRHGYEKPGLTRGLVARSFSTYSASLESQQQASTPETVTDETKDSQDAHPDRISHVIRGRQLLADKVRRIMRKVPHPVAVITATDTTASPSGGPKAWRGATVSSLNTVTLVPYPVISFNINKISSTLDAIYATGQFNVHFLSSNSYGRTIASKFARGNASSPFHDKHGNLERFAPQEEAGQVPMAAGPPIISPKVSNRRTYMAPIRLHCMLMREKVVGIGDHLVVFGRVVRTFYQPGYFSSDGPGETPVLVYADGNYNVCAKRRLSDTIFKHVHVTNHVEEQAGGSANAPVDEESGVQT